MPPAISLANALREVPAFNHLNHLKISLSLRLRPLRLAANVIRRTMFSFAMGRLLPDGVREDSRESGRRPFPLESHSGGSEF